MHTRRAASLLAAVGAVAVVACLADCTNVGPRAEQTPASACVPGVGVDTAIAHPGDTLAVTVDGGCARPTPEKGWVVDVGPVGHPDEGVRATSRRPLDDGFTVQVTLPDDFRTGDAMAILANLPTAPCHDTGASCAVAAASFTVAPGAP